MAGLYDDHTREQLLDEIVRWKRQAAENANVCFRLTTALKLARQFGVSSRAFDGGVSHDISDWIDGGMKEGLLWPTSIFVDRWLTDNGYSKSSKGMITIRAAMTLAPDLTVHFPILQDAEIKSIPWAMIAPHERQAAMNHGQQSLADLARRGGLSVCEAAAVLEDRRWRNMPVEGARACIREHLTRFHGSKD